LRENKFEGLKTLEYQSDSTPATEDTLHLVVTQLTMLVNSIAKGVGQPVFKSFTGWFSLISNLKRSKYLIFAPGFAAKTASGVAETMKEKNTRDRNNKEI